MKGIIIGAGRGSRLMPYTTEQPKCFAELGGGRILDWVVSALSGGGLHDLVFVGGYRIDDVRQQYPRFSFRHNDNWQHNNVLASLMYAESDMDDGFVSSYADIVYTPEAVRAVVDSPGDIVLAVDTAWRRRYRQRSEHPESDGEKVLVNGDRVERIDRHIDSEAAEGEFIGVAKFSASAASQLKKRYHELGANPGPDAAFRNAKEFRKAYLIDMVQELIDSGADARIARVDGGYYEIDTTQDYHIAQREWPGVAREKGAKLVAKGDHGQ